MVQIEKLTLLKWKGRNESRLPRFFGTLFSPFSRLLYFIAITCEMIMIFSVKQSDISLPYWKRWITALADVRVHIFFTQFATRIHLGIIRRFVHTEMSCKFVDCPWIVLWRNVFTMNMRLSVIRLGNILAVSHRCVMICWLERQVAGRHQFNLGAFHHFSDNLGSMHVIYGQKSRCHHFYYKTEINSGNRFEREP